MSETTACPRWTWRCTAASCPASYGTFRTEDEARKPADRHSRDTGHRVAWGLLQGDLLR